MVAGLAVGGIASKMPRSNKLSDVSAMSYDENTDELSTMGCHRSSVRSLESTIDRGLVSSLTRQIVEEEKELHNSDVAGCDEDEEEGGLPSRGGNRGGRSSLWIFRKWTDFISRVSRAASSLLNQHSHNLSDLLEVTEDTHLEVPPPLSVTQASISGRQSWPHDSIDIEHHAQIITLRNEVAMLKKRIRELEYERDGKNRHSDDGQSYSIVCEQDAYYCADQTHDIPAITNVQTLRPDQITRYSRQLLLNDGFGVAGQKKLLSSSILVIGAGGIGSTVLMYLAAVGVGHITIVDYDCIEMSNLHRQIIHKDCDSSKSLHQIGLNKALSARNSLLALNPTLSCTALAITISAKNALELVSKHDVVVDACDNPKTRYLVNDACVLAGKPLVSGSAMGTEGQLTVYNYTQETTTDQAINRTACYRCLYPTPVTAEGCKSCSDNGVLGMVPGAIGILQAVEVVKVLTGIGSIMHDRLMMYDSLSCSFRGIKKPPPKSNCAVCSPGATIKTMTDSERSMENVRGPVPSSCVQPHLERLAAEQNVSCLQFNDICKNSQPHVLLDVRQARQYEMCSLDGSINLPLDTLESNLDRVGSLSRDEVPVYCICRRGVASAEATLILQQSIDDGNAHGIHSVYNISGGLNSWVETAFFARAKRDEMPAKEMLSHPASVSSESEAESFLQKLNAIIVEAGTIDLKEFRNHYESLFVALKRAYAREIGLDKLYQELTARHDTSVADLESVKSSNKCIASEVENLQLLIASANERERSSAATICELKEELKSIRTCLAASETAIASRDNEAKQLSCDVAEWKQRTATADERNISLEVEYRKVISQVEQLQISQRDLLERTYALNDLVAKKNDEIAHGNEKRDHIQQELDSVQSKLQYKTQECTDLQYASSVCQSKAAAIETSLAEAKKIAVLKEQDLESEKALTKKLSSVKLEQNTTISVQAEQLSQLQCEINKMIEDRSRAMSEESQLRTTLEVERQAVVRLEKVLDDVNAANRLSNDEALMLRKEVEKLRTNESNEISMLKQEIDVLIGGIRKTEEMVGQTNSVIREKENVIESMKRELAEAKDAATRQELLFRSLEGEFSVMQQQGEDSQLTLQRLRDELKRMEDQTKVLSNINEEKKSEVEVAKRENDLIRCELIDVMKDLADTQKALVDSEQEKMNEQRLTDALKSDLVGKESELRRVQSAYQGEKAQNEIFSDEISKLKDLLSENEGSLRTHQVEAMRLNATVRDLEETALAQTKEFDRVTNERDILGSSLIRRNDELALLYEKIKILQNNRLRGELQYNNKLDDIRILKIKIRELQKRITTTTCGRAENELDKPIHVHRWHMLEGSDPHAYDMTRKIKILQKRLLQKTEEVLMKNSVIQEQEREQKETKKVLARQPGPEIVEQLHNVQQDVTKKVKQMKAMAGELNLNKTEVYEYKREIERLATELHDFKRKYFELKRRQTVEKERELDMLLSVSESSV